ncbi:MAG: carboxymuconolactone decarboxylase family protein [Phycisphaerales bacterium]|nr:carboxymuconolactone decarboxylase family protein [Planctomycetota bacterium]MCH8507298.1 carboxymuconolactone decarboxylase family protein [Phycisphaerales bacterium]
MPRIQPVKKDKAPESSKPMLEGVEKKIGKVPNLLGTLAVSPAGLATYLKLGEALSQASINEKVREQIAVAIANESGCEYCASAHTAIGKNHGVDADELAKNLEGKASDPKVQGMIDLALAIVAERGWVTDAQFKAAKDAGLSDAEIVEVLSITMTNLFTNYANHLFQTANDFPKVEVKQAAAAS